MSQRSIYLIALAALSAALPSAAQTRSQTQAVHSFIDEMVGKHGFDRGELQNVFGTMRFRPRIVELMNRQAKRKPWNEYRSLFINAEKITGGRRFWQSHRDELALASERYGVPAEIIVAVIGVETHYGRHTGRFKVLEALTTLAFDYPKRAAMFRTELEHYLLLAREEALPLNAPLGSYAGAMGIAQFMPGSYRRYAVDFDGDGKRDLFANTSDAIGSVANYLTAHGWQRNEPVAAPAILEGAHATPPFEASRLSSRYSLEELKERGVTATGAFPTTKRAIPLTLERHDGPEYWLGFDNFYVITRYNHSTYYAMAVYQLAEALKQDQQQRAAGRAP
jgi:membrane-bound lytic murein transglycosylase B